MTFRACLTFVLAAALLSGCQRLNYESSAKVPPFGVHRIEFDPPKYAQKITIETHSPGSPVSVYLVRQEDSDAAQDQLDKDKTPSASLAGKDKSEDITLEATVPAKTAFSLLIRADKKSAEVRVKVTGR
jgi:hypothetical protein